MQPRRLLVPALTLLIAVPGLTSALVTPAGRDANDAVVAHRLEIHEDTTVERRIRSALLRDAVVDRFDIGVRVFDGTAYLSGTVDSWSVMMHAADIAAGTRGVVEVENDIEVAETAPARFGGAHSI